MKTISNQDTSRYASMVSTQHRKQWTSVYHGAQPKEHIFSSAMPQHSIEIVPKSLTLNGLADDHSIRKSFRPTAPINNSSSAHSEEDDTITIMQNSMLDIKSWMDAVKVKLNETKTEFIYFGGKQQLAKTRRNTININGETIERTNKIKYLGGHLDSSLTIKDHIIAKSKAATINIIKIRNIRKYLNQDICQNLSSP